MLRATTILMVLGSLVLPAAAHATIETASSGAVTATLSYKGGIGPEIKDLKLTIAQSGRVVYDEPIKSKQCLTTCWPAGTKNAVHVLDLAGNDELEVVVDLFTGGASCCELEQVFSPSAALDSYVLTEHNFGEDGDRIEHLGPGAGLEFVSGDSYFACEFTDCAGSGLPIQIFSFSGGAFHNVTREYPKQISSNAAFWWKSYEHNLKNDPTGLIAPWAADEDLLGKTATVSSTLAKQVSEHHITERFVKQLQAFLKKHGYTG